MNDERTVLTREIIQKKLVREAVRTILGDTAMLIMGAVLFLILYLLAASALPKQVALLIVGIPAALFLLLRLVGLTRGLIQLIRATGSTFTVFEDRLTHVENSKFNLLRFLLTFPYIFPTNTKAWHDHVFKFESGKRFVANSAEYQTTHLDAAAQVSSAGDSYITVFYDYAPDKIILLYSTKMFVYKD